MAEKGPEGLGLNGAQHLSLPTDHYITTATSFSSQTIGRRARARGSVVVAWACEVMGQLEGFKQRTRVNTTQTRG